MGLILDSSVLITAERQGQNARQMLAAISSQVGNTEIALSVVILIELAHGAARADTPQRKAKRQQSSRNCSRPFPSIRLLFRLPFVPGRSMAKIRLRAFAFPSPIC